MKFSDRLGKLAPYPFVEISRIIAEKKAAGVDIVTFGIGDPDIPTPQPIIDKLMEASQDPPNHRYPETDGLPEVRRAIAHWYEQRFGVQLDPDKEVLPLIGAKEGIGHAAFCFLDPGDIALIPDPAYPVYGVGTMFAGAESHIMPLYERNGWLPELDAIPGPVADAAKLMWLNYPNNPTSAVATHEDLAAAVAYCREKDIALLHDAAYSEIGYEGYRATSCMQVDGAKDVSLEFHSLSKTYNMTGWRIGMAVGNAAKAMLGKTPGTTTLTILDANGRLITNVDVRVAADVTEFKAVYQQLIQAQKMRLGFTQCPADDRQQTGRQQTRE